MSVQNLATVFGPNILRPQIEDPVTIMEGTSLVQHLMTVLIRKHSQLFTARAAEGPASPRGGPPCAVGWGSEEVTKDSQAEPSTLSRTSPKGLGSHCSPAATSPGKRVQTLPNWKSSFRQPGSRSGSPKAGSSALEVPDTSSSGNWLMNGLSSLRGHRRASSGDRLKDPGSAQRLSTYDNVPPAGPGASTPSGASTAGSGASSGDASPSDTGSPVRDRAHRSEALQGLVTELRAELCRQRTEYQTSLRRLEEGSADLRKQMSRLEEELDQEKKKYTMLEIKLRNSERAREDAERRNQLLQKEMEEPKTELLMLSPMSPN
uniref:Rho GTPase activating protein 22 n=1 Tax=Equus asinus asinus TaxID=83772 RepID=A0A8C4MKI3_EQUAS